MRKLALSGLLMLGMFVQGASVAAGASGGSLVGPVANPDSYATPVNTPLSVGAPGVLGNDSDATFAVLWISQSCGTLTFNQDGSFTYDPGNGCVGTVDFAYRAYDGVAYSALATVTITVSNNVPTAADDSYSTPANTPLFVAAPGVLANDADPQLPGQQPQPFTAVLWTGVSCGALTFSQNQNGSFIYDPGNGCVGTVDFTYRAYDGVAYSALATVKIMVSPTTVTVRSFAATRAAAGVVLRWSTASEVGSLGFNLYRQRHGKLVKLNRTLIPSVSGSTTKGHAYSWLDRRAPRGSGSLRYRLQAVSLDGTRLWVGSAAAATR